MLTHRFFFFNLCFFLGWHFFSLSFIHFLIFFRFLLVLYVSPSLPILWITNLPFLLNTTTFSLFEFIQIKLQKWGIIAVHWITFARWLIHYIFSCMTRISDASFHIFILLTTFHLRNRVIILSWHNFIFILTFWFMAPNRFFILLYLWCSFHFYKRKNI